MVAIVYASVADEGISYTAPMKSEAHHHWNPNRLDVKAFAQAGASVSANEPMVRFVRMSAEMPLEVQAAEWSVQWLARGELRAGTHNSEPSVWVYLKAEAEMPLCCQRCLSPVTTHLVVDRWFRFVANEALAAAEDEDSEEDVLAMEPRPSLLELLEDELLMALPLVPLHAVCPLTVATRAGGETDLSDADEPPQRHPFAELAKLKK